MERKKWNAKRVRELRVRLGWTQPELAAQLEVTRNTVTRWEMGTVKPDKWHQHLLNQLETEEPAA